MKMASAVCILSALFAHASPPVVCFDLFLGRIVLCCGTRPPVEVTPAFREDQSGGADVPADVPRARQSTLWLRSSTEVQARAAPIARSPRCCRLCFPVLRSLHFPDPLAVDVPGGDQGPSDVEGAVLAPRPLGLRVTAWPGGDRRLPPTVWAGDAAGGTVGI